jgi:hypothetical protein
LPVTYDYRAKKLVAVLAVNLSAGVALNVIGHMALAMGIQRGDELVERDHYLDASGVWHAGISRYPLIVARSGSGKLRRLIELARQQQDIHMVDFPETMLVTGHDDQLAAALASVKEGEINYLGALLYGDAVAVTSLTSRFSLWQ